MNAPKQRRIHVASFSKEDVSRAHLFMFFGGLAIVVAAAGAAWAGAVNYRAVAEAKGAARQVLAVANQSILGAANYGGGGAERLAAATTAMAATNASVGEMRSTAGAVVVAPALGAAAQSANGAWLALAGALTDVNGSVASAAEVAEGLGRSSQAVATLIRQIEATGRQNAGFARAHESALRLYTYAEAGFGAASIARVDYDMRVLVADLGTSELRTAIGFVESLMPLSKAAVTTSITREQLARVNETAIKAKAAAEKLGVTAMGASSALWLAIGSTLVLACGLVLMWLALQRVLEDFGRRYVRAMSQFRAGEGARKDLAGKLRSAIEGNDEDFALEEPSLEMQELADLVGELRGRYAALLSEIAAALQAASAGEEGVSKTAVGLESMTAGIMESMSAVSQRMTTMAAHARMASVDAAAAAHAAEEAGQRSADANRVAQDSASRLEALREGLQETSKGIKRLGERTQDINAVVDGMELLSEQIGVLSLNASLEAERAGEAGAGFRLVAKEVQQLARRSEQALQQMSQLVQGAQADARSAAEAVERSTGQVVAGSNVGAVSQALLVAMTPLAQSVESMTRSIAESAKEGAASLLNADSEAQRGRIGIEQLEAAVAKLSTPLSQVRARLGHASSLVGAAR